MPTQTGSTPGPSKGKGKGKPVPRGGPTTSTPGELALGGPKLVQFNLLVEQARQLIRTRAANFEQVGALKKLGAYDDEVTELEEFATVDAAALLKDLVARVKADKAVR